MSTALRRAARARDLPDEWDRLADSLFQRRDFLEHAERHNPCAQRYWILEEQGVARAGAICYTLPLDLLTFLGMRSPLRMQVLGIPCSVSPGGLLGIAEETRRLLRHVLPREKGLLLGLNLPQAAPLPGLLQGRTLPTLVLRSGFPDREAYLAALRAPYRRWLLAQLKRFQGVSVATGSCADFDDEAHALYLQVFRRSRAKLECLGREFFRELPPAFRFTTSREAGRLVGWQITVRDGDCLRFFLGGVDYARAQRLSTYFNLLIQVVEAGLSQQAPRIDLGQTAEVPKQRLGARPEELGLFAWHPSAWARLGLRSMRGLLEYRRRTPELHVFKTDAGGKA